MTTRGGSLFRCPPRGRDWLYIKERAGAGPAAPAAKSPFLSAGAGSKTDQLPPEGFSINPVAAELEERASHPRGRGKTK